MFTLLLAVGLAVAQDDGYVEIRPADETPLDVVRFTLTTCDAVRAEAVDKRPVEARAPAVVIELTNGTSTLCMYRGVALKGGLAGAYSVNRKLEGNGGFFIAPGESARVRVSPADPKGPRDRIRMQIPPDSGIVILIGEPAP
ncbi:MAG TPA: hypothetical protein PKA64_24375 [Myxococcota bacterium]|nr:hypothetical protein [Myxococcota bacterium]